MRSLPRSSIFLNRFDGQDTHYITELHTNRKKYKMIRPQRDQATNRKDVYPAVISCDLIRKGIRMKILPPLFYFVTYKKKILYFLYENPTNYLLFLLHCWDLFLSAFLLKEILFPLPASHRWGDKEMCLLIGKLEDLEF